MTGKKFTAILVGSVLTLASLVFLIQVFDPALFAYPRYLLRNEISALFPARNAALAEKHPYDLFHEDFRSIAENALGDRYESFAENLNVSPGSALFEDNFIVGSACATHLCGTYESFYVLDLRNAELFAATTSEGKVEVLSKASRRLPKEIEGQYLDWVHRMENEAEPIKVIAAPSELFLNSSVVFGNRIADSSVAHFVKFVFPNPETSQWRANGEDWILDVTYVDALTGNRHVAGLQFHQLSSEDSLVKLIRVHLNGYASSSEAEMLGMFDTVRQK